MCLFFFGAIESFKINMADLEEFFHLSERSVYLYGSYI